MPDYVAFNQTESIALENIFTAVKDDMIKLLKMMLDLNPTSRCTCAQALQSSYFSNEPAPTPPQLLPQPTQNLEELPTAGTKRSNLGSMEKMAPSAKRLNFDE